LVQFEGGNQYATFAGVAERKLGHRLNYFSRP
jgi:hypothetical protein